MSCSQSKSQVAHLNSHGFGKVHLRLKENCVMFSMKLIVGGQVHCKSFTTQE